MQRLGIRRASRRRGVPGWVGGSVLVAAALALAILSAAGQAGGVP
jgi:hypothetical protein